ncbi:hypothetical protein [Haloarchaeobius sp. HME9146]|uniref:hypothetical protein n=1 Tax=Haloarchaeobius sp. HME9146 TaxID=2978732 RepID=UPI0021C1C380|nr:hypothetical protein [Haloarchaeobius sp. HME9146]MCT9094696.1 hypothetical protein [Haloarchaeobius sp. HME9146]
MENTDSHGATDSRGSWVAVALLVGFAAALGAAGYLQTTSYQFENLPVMFALAGVVVGGALTLVEADTPLSALVERVPSGFRTAAYILAMLAVVTFLTEREGLTLVLGFGGGILLTTALLLSSSRLRS